MNVAKKKDREAMGQRLTEIVLHAGGGICRVDPDLEGPREIGFDIAAGPLRLGIEFNGDDHQQRRDCWVLAWHIVHHSDARMSEAFEAAAKSSVNPFHRRKCTAVAWSFEELCQQVRDVLALVKDGRAFE